MAEPNWNNRTLFVADNIRILRGMNSESVDCIATDPPFNKKRIFNAPLGSRQAEQRFDDRWRWDEVTDEWQDLIATDHPAIKEIIEAAVVIEGGKVDHHTGRISTGRVKNSMAAFLAYMAPRVVEMHRVLKPTGVLLMQCDTEANAYLRLLLDAVFGRKKFINEITRRRAVEKGDPTRRLANNSDTVLAYGKTTRHKWNPQFVPYNMAVLNSASLDDPNLDEDTRKTLQQYKHFDGPRRYSLDNLVEQSKNRPNLTYEFLGVTRVWRWRRERMEAEYAAGRVVQTKPGNVPRYKRYLDEQPGRKRDDIWDDVWKLESSELDWDTRKPLSLYKRLIECGSDESDIVLDPFAGCATACVAAEVTGRQWVGIDIDPVAEDATFTRLREATGLNMTEQPVTVRKSPPRRQDVERVPDDKLRDALWSRQARRCANPYCDSENLRKVDLQLDHRIPRIRGGDDGVLNRIALCANCNARKGAKAWGRFLDEERAKLPHDRV
ncbi:MAG: restriction endonuclease subunit M [Chloroflexi bacterium]|nr:restriction endonuclease subunit M [Chloroflexota bacterium]